MQQANTTNFPKSQPQHCRQEEKRASWALQHSSLLPRTSQFFMQPKQRDSRTSIIKLRSFKQTNSCPGTAAVQHVLLLELEAPKALDAAERGWNHCQCWMESHPWQCFPGWELGTAHAIAVTGLQRGGEKLNIHSCKSSTPLHLFSMHLLTGTESPELEKGKDNLAQHP